MSFCLLTLAQYFTRKHQTFNYLAGKFGKAAYVLTIKRFFGDFSKCQDTKQKSLFPIK